MRMLRWIFYLALTAAVVYGGYLVYMTWVQGKPITSLWQKAQEYASTTAGTVSSVTDTVNSVQTSVASATSAFESAKTSVGNVLSGIGTAMANLGTSLTGESSSSTTTTTTSSASAQSQPSAPPVTASSSPTVSLTAPPPATVTTPVNVPLYFSLTNGTRYDVDWGDGTTSSGGLNNGTPTVVEHSWKTAGHYTVAVTIDGNSYTFPIRVYNQ